MRKHLYDSIADKWLKPGGTIWVISDTHFNDAESQGYRKAYPGDEELVKKINSRVGKNDTLILLGDVGDLEFAKKLRGYKVLLLGNHDKGASNYKKIVTRTVGQVVTCEDGSQYYTIKEATNNLFDEVYEGPIMINDRVILSHEPIAVPEYMFNIHGHTHGLPHIYDERHLNVCAEAIDYTPINMLKLIQEGLLKDTKSIHELTVADATKRKIKRNLKKIDKMLEELKHD